MNFKPPRPYEFGLEVKDEYTYNDYNRHESSDGKAVQGSYRTALPDGRIQTVTYKDDGYSGFVADVSYEGEPKYDYAPKASYPKSYAPAYPKSYEPSYPKYSEPSYKPVYKSEPYKSEPYYEEPSYPKADSYTPVYTPKYPSKY